MVNPMIDILFRSNDVFDAVSSACHFCDRGLDKTCPQKLIQKLCQDQYRQEAEKMAKRIRYTPEQIITKLREAEVRWRVSQGKNSGTSL